MMTQELKVIELKLADFAGKDPFLALKKLEDQLRCKPVASFALVATPKACVAACSSPRLAVLNGGDAPYAALIGSGGAARSGEAMNNDAAIAQAQYKAAADLVAKILEAGRANQDGRLVLLLPLRPPATQVPAAQIVFG